MAQQKINGNQTRVFMPNYAAQETTNLWTGATYTADRVGFLYVYLYTYSTAAGAYTQSIYVNSKLINRAVQELTHTNSAKPITSSIVIPISPGDVLSFSATSVNGKEAYFIPGKWV